MTPSHPVLPTLLCIIALLLLQSGCQTPDRSVRPMHGQLSFRTADDMGTVGDVTIVPADTFQIIFYKGPGEPLLRLENNGQTASARGMLAGPGWSGRVTDAPDRLQPWLALRSVFRGPDPEPNPRQPAFRVERRTDGATGELVEVFVDFFGRADEFTFRFD